TVVKSKRKSKKTAVSGAKENVRRSKRERSALCTAKPKTKDLNRNSGISSPRQTAVSVISNSSRSKRRNKRRESASEATASKRRSSGRITKPPKKKQSATTDNCEIAAVNLSDEPTYCLCNRVSFGDMIGCDNEKCTVEWFHFGCVQLKSKPKGKWYCPLCRGERTNILKGSSGK
uniref:PHD-type domain-containing protein n=1 Tax=Syphacia muris TaxID=451379 RepID=A0A0N5AFI8_9BILA